MLRLLTMINLVLLLFVLSSNANSLEDKPDVIWRHVDSHDIGVIGKLESKKIIAVFSSGKPIQIGGEEVIQDESLPKHGTVLMSGKIIIDSIIYPINSNEKKYEQIWVTWTEEVALSPGWTSSSMCSTLSKKTLNGEKAIFLINNEKASLEIEHELAMKYLPNYNKAKKKLVDKANAEWKAIADEIWGPDK